MILAGIKASNSEVPNHRIEHYGAFRAEVHAPLRLGASMQASSWIALFQVLSLVGIVLAFVSTLGLSYFSARLEREKNATIVALESRIDTARAKVVAAAAKVDLVLRWSALGTSQSWKSVTTGSVGYVAFARGEEPLLVIRSQHVIAEATSPDLVSFKAFCDLNAPDSLVRASLRELGKAEVLQVALPNVPDGVVVDSGSVQVTLNGDRQLVFPVANATVQGGKIVLGLKDVERQLALGE